MPKNKVSVQDWLQLGIKLFSEGGVQAIKVEQMARILGCTKGSFYWHFKSRKYFLEQLLEYWVQIGTERFIEGSKPISSPKDQLRYVLIEVFRSREGKDFMFYLRQFAQENQEVEKLINQVEQQRIDFIAKLLTQMDVSDANERSEMLYHYYLGWYERTKYHSPSESQIQQELHRLSLLLNVDLT